MNIEKPAHAGDLEYFLTAALWGKVTLVVASFLGMLLLVALGCLKLFSDLAKRDAI